MKNYFRLSLLFITCAVVICQVFAVSEAVAGPAQDSERQSTTAAPRAPDTGALIEPTRRMRYKDSPWEYEIRIGLPASYHQTTKSYPVLWVTDGSFQFESAVDIVNSSEHLPEMIVVAIGTPPEAQNETARRRIYDFSSTNSDFCGSSIQIGGNLYQQLCKAAVGGSENTGVPPVDKFGGAPKFLEFITNELRHALTSDYRMANDNTLFGFSAGGSFCIYAMLARPEGFDRYICGSPNLNMDGGAVFKMEEQYSTTHKDLKAKVFMSAGEGEMLQGGFISASGLVSWMARMVEILKARNYPSLDLHARIFPGAVHDGLGAKNSLYWGLQMSEH